MSMARIEPSWVVAVKVARSDLPVELLAGLS
jgi:hypothetical protein